MYFTYQQNATFWFAYFKPNLLENKEPSKVCLIVLLIIVIFTKPAVIPNAVLTTIALTIFDTITCYRTYFSVNLAFK